MSVCGLNFAKFLILLPLNCTVWRHTHARAHGLTTELTEERQEHQERIISSEPGKLGEATEEMASPHLSCSIPAVAWQLAHLGVAAGFSWVEAPGGPVSTACQGANML